MRKLLLALSAAAVAVAIAGATAASSAPPVTIGQTLPGAGVCAPSYIVPSDQAAYVVPAGNWNLTTWNTQANAAGGSMALVIFRPTSPGSYLVVGESPVEPLTPNTLNTFTLATPIAVQGGDILGMWTNDWTAACAVGTPSIGNTPYDAYAPLPTVGTPVTPTWTNPYLLVLNISATLTAPLPTSKDQCKNDGWKNFGVAFKNQGDCVSYVATHGTNLPAGS